MGLQETDGYCGNCDREVMIRRQGTRHVLHLLMSLVTLGFWIPVWILASIRIGGWRCTVCGRSTRAAAYPRRLIVGVLLIIIVWFLMS